MNTPRHRFTVIPTLVALFSALMNLPETNVVKVDSNGMGIEHEQPWRRRSNGLTGAVAGTARSILDRLTRAFGRARQHAVFGPVLTAVALLLVVVVLNVKALAAAPFVIGALTEGRHAAEFLIDERPGPGYPSRENITVLSGQTLKAGAVCGRVRLGIGRVSIPTVVGTGTGTATLVSAGPEVEVGNYVLTCTTAVAHGGVFSLTTPSGKALPTFTMTPGSGATTAYTSRHINFSITDSTDFIAGDVFTFVVSTTAPTVIGGTGTGVMTSLSLGPEAIPGNYKVVNRAVVAEGGDFEVIAPNGASIGRFLMGTTSTGTATFTSSHITFTLSDATDYILNNHFNVAVFNQLAGGKVVAWDPTTFDGRHRATGLLYDNVDAASGDLPGVIFARDCAIVKGSLEWGATITAAQKESAYLDLAKVGIIAR